LLEYTATLVNYAAADYFYKHNPDPSNPLSYGIVLRRQHSIEVVDGQGVQQLTHWTCFEPLTMCNDDEQQCYNDGHYTGQIITTNNVIADRIYSIKRETNSLCDFKSILQDYPELAVCKRFQPSAALISHLMDAISQKKFIDPMEVNASILRNPGQATS